MKNGSCPSGVTGALVQLLMQMLQMFEQRSERTTPEAVIEEADELVVHELFARIRHMTRGTDGDADAS
jgi:hypothetical protein